MSPHGWTPRLATMLGGIRALVSQDGAVEVASFVGVDGRARVTIRYLAADGAPIPAESHEIPGEAAAWVLAPPLRPMTEDDLTVAAMGLARAPMTDGVSAVLQAIRNVDARGGS